MLQIFYTVCGSRFHRMNYKQLKHIETYFLGTFYKIIIIDSINQLITRKTIQINKYHGKNLFLLNPGPGGSKKP